MILHKSHPTIIYAAAQILRFIISPGPSAAWSIVPAGDGDGIFLPVPTVYRSGAKPPPTLIADTALYVLGLPKDDTAEGTGMVLAMFALFPLETENCHGTV